MRVFVKQEFKDDKSREEDFDRSSVIYDDRESQFRKRDRNDDSCYEPFKRRDFVLDDIRRDLPTPKVFVLEGKISTEDARKFQDQANRFKGQLNVWDVVLESARDYITMRLVGDLHQILVPPHDIDRWWETLSVGQVAELVMKYYGPRGELTTIEQAFKDLPFELCYADERIEDAAHVGFIQAVREYLHTNPELTISQHAALSNIIEQRLPPKSKILEDYLKIKEREGAPETYIIALRRLKVCMSAVRELLKQAARYGPPNEKYVHKYDDVPDVSCDSSVDENFSRSGSELTRNSTHRSNIMRGSSLDSNDSLSLGSRQCIYTEVPRKNCSVVSGSIERSSCSDEKLHASEWGVHKTRTEATPSDLSKSRDHKDHKESIVVDSISSSGSDKIKRSNEKNDNNNNNNINTGNNNNNSGNGNSNNNINSRNITQQRNGRRLTRESSSINYSDPDQRQHTKRKTRRSKRLGGSTS
jgi:hypothetical protein